MQKQWRQQQTRAEVEPEDSPVKRVELAREVERVKNERCEADKIEMQRMGRPGSFQQNKDADQKINEPDDFEILLMAQVLLWRWRRYERHGNFFFVSDNRVGGSRPSAQLVQNLGDVPITSDRNRVAISRRDRLQNIARLDTR